MRQPALFWDKVAASYAKQPIRDEDAYARTLERTRAHLRPDDAMLELGCGTGSTALALADAVGTVVASDFSPKMIEIARDRAEAAGAANVRFVCADATDPTLAERDYDAVTAFNLLHLLPDAPAAIRHVHGLLKPGGLFISKTPGAPGPGSPLFFRAMPLVLPLLQAIGKAPFVKFVERDVLERAIEDAGFAIVERGDYPVAPPNRFIVARKL